MNWGFQIIYGTLVPILLIIILLCLHGWSLFLFLPQLLLCIPIGINFWCPLLPVYYWQLLLFFPFEIAHPSLTSMFWLIIYYWILIWIRIIQFFSSFLLLLSLLDHIEMLGLVCSLFVFYYECILIMQLQPFNLHQ